MSASANYCIYPSGVGIIEEQSKVCWATYRRQMELDRNMILCANNFEPLEKGGEEFQADWNLDR